VRKEGDLPEEGHFQDKVSDAARCATNEVGFRLSDGLQFSGQAGATYGEGGGEGGVVSKELVDLMYLVGEFMSQCNEDVKGG